MRRRGELPRCSVHPHTIIFVLTGWRALPHLSFCSRMWCHVVISALISVWITVIQGPFPPFLLSFSPFPGSLPPAWGICSAVEEYKCLQGLALSLWPRPLVESWPWVLFDFFREKKKKTRKKKAVVKIPFLLPFLTSFFPHTVFSSLFFL